MIHAKAIALSCAFLISGCRDKADVKAESTGAMSAPKLRVRVVKPKREQTSGERVLPGVLLPWQRAQLGARAPGELTTITVDRGDRVKKGQLLATIGIPGLTQDVQRAGAQKQTAQAELALLEDQQRRMAQVIASGPKGVIAEAEVAAVDARIVAAKARIASAAADQGHGGAMLSDTRVVAPFDGVVVERRADRGTALSAGTIIVEVADVSTLRMTIDVPERDAPSVKLDQKATIIIAAMQGQKLAGKVARFAPTLDEATRTLRVEIDVPNADGALLAGVAARAAIDLGSRGEVLVLPAEAIIQDGGEAFVFTVESDVAHKKKIAIAYDRGAFVEIADGLTGDEEVIIGGRGLVREGAPCEVAR